MTGNAIITIPEVGLTEIDNEPRVRDIELGERLGFGRARDIRRLIERNFVEIEQFGTCAMAAHVVRGNPVKEYWLNEEQALLLAVLSNAPNAPAVRAMLIRVFVAYRRGHMIDTPLPATLDDKTKNAIGGIVKSCAGVAVREEIQKAIAPVLAQMMPIMVQAYIAQNNFMLRQGKTANDIMLAHGFPKGFKSLSRWFGNRLDEVGCRQNGNDRADINGKAVRLYDPDKADAWMRNGGALVVQQKIAERQGQGKLRLVASNPEVRANG